MKTKKQEYNLTNNIKKNVLTLLIPLTPGHQTANMESFPETVL